MKKREIDLAITELEGRPASPIQSCTLVRLPLVLVVPKRSSFRSLQVDPGESVPWLTGPLRRFGERLGTILFRVPDGVVRNDERLAGLTPERSPGLGLRPNALEHELLVAEPDPRAVTKARCRVDAPAVEPGAVARAGVLQHRRPRQHRVTP